MGNCTPTRYPNSRFTACADPVDLAWIAYRRTQAVILRARDKRDREVLAWAQPVLARETRRLRHLLRQPCPSVA